MVEHLPSMPKVMSSIPSSAEAGEEGASKTLGAAGLVRLWGNVRYGGMTSNPRRRPAQGRGVRAHLLPKSPHGGLNLSHPSSTR